MLSSFANSSHTGEGPNVPKASKEFPITENMRTVAIHFKRFRHVFHNVLAVL